MIEINNLSKSFGRIRAIDNITLKIEPGIHGLLGPNGAGKTTLFRCITGIIKKDEGVINAPSDISYLPQKFGFYPSLTVEDSMLYFSKLKNITGDFKSENTNLLEKVRLTDMKKKKIKSLSGGMLRRLGIAIALQGTPSLLLVDEPTAGLDPEERLNFKQILFEIGQEISIVISTHIVSDLESLCDKIIVMNNGEILFHDNSEKLAQYAENKVYEVRDDDLKKSNEPYYLIKKHISNGENLNRIISNQMQPFTPVPSNIEDGYMMHIKNFENNEK